MMIQTQRLKYVSHAAEIEHLNSILASIPKPYPPELQSLVETILGRLDVLMTAQGAELSLYDQREERV